MFSLIVFLPLLAAIMAAGFSFSKHHRMAEITTVSALLLSLLLSIALFWHILAGGQAFFINLSRFI